MKCAQMKARDHRVNLSGLSEVSLRLVDELVAAPAD